MMLKKVLSLRDLKPFGIKAVGIGTPCIIEEPDTGQPIFIFEIWEDIDVKQMKIYYTQIDEELNILTRPKLITTSEVLNYFGVESLATPRPFWDDYNEEWVIMCVTYPFRPAIATLFCNREFDVVDMQDVPLYNASGTPVRLGWRGVSTLPLYDAKLLIFSGASMWYIEDFRVRPLPSPTQVNASGTTIFSMFDSEYIQGISETQPLAAGSGLRLVAQLLSQRKRFYVVTMFGINEEFIYGGSPIPFKWTLPIIPVLPLHFNEILGHFLHPWYTNILGEPMLFFVRFVTFNSFGKRRTLGEIYATTVDPEMFVEPEGKTLYTGGTNEIYTIPDRIPIPTFGAKKVIINLYGVATAGTLTVTESHSPANIWLGKSEVYQSTYSINAGSNKVVVDSPAPYIALGIDQNLRRYSVTIRW